MVESIVAGVGPVSSSSPRRVASVALAGPACDRWGRSIDTVEIVETALAEARLQESAPIRAALVARVREEISTDTYLSDEKLDLALTRMLHALKKNE